MNTNPHSKKEKSPNQDSTGVPSTNLIQSQEIVHKTTNTNYTQLLPINSKTKTPCNCKNSQCLKLYCECFAAMIYCDPKLCSCRNCMNSIANNVCHNLNLLGH